MTIPSAATKFALFSAWRETSSMAEWLGLDVSYDEFGAVYQLTFREDHIGNALVRALHGGVISSFAQVCAYAEAITSTGTQKQCKVVSVHCNYLRPAHATNTFARVHTLQKGRRLIFMDVAIWQDAAEEEVARASVAIRRLASASP